MITKRNIRCALIGVGRLGYVHAKNLVYNVEGAELVYIVTSREESARRAAAKLGVEKWTTDVNEVFEDTSIDAVIIATPTNTHTQLLKDAALHKKHIFVDKPLTETVEEAKTVNEIIKQNNVKCMVGFMRRFDPDYAEAKKVIESGAIGRPLKYIGISRDPGSPPEEFIKNSGGIFLDLCIHEYDIAQYLLGANVKAVSSFGKTLLHPFMDKYNDVDQSISYLEFDNGSVASVEGSRNSSYGYDIRGEVIGTEGTIKIGSLKEKQVNTLNQTGSYHQNVPDFQDKFKDAFRLEMIHFIDCIKNDQKPLITEVDGKQNMEVAAAAKKSFETADKQIVG
ncbi:Gfo/Idh/MocA family oxidoreductase [Alteribacillus sp. YIM 98480]|uniref:Gfo/Idh/MocA family oxidoreductase n=1 Tax=Alteribacillus sp. YIM 98480 TaxID=2606599 RepID=UPI00271466AA|nr:Gfo/Idh/MocA family oxidoreductase [Alteribacillus sp. YIM 98480]